MKSKKILIGLVAALAILLGGYGATQYTDQPIVSGDFNADVSGTSQMGWRRSGNTLKVFPTTTNVVTGTLTTGTTTVESFTWGGNVYTLTDADGGNATMTQAILANASVIEVAAGGSAQAVIQFIMPATSTMTTLIPNAGDCRSWLYDASALAAATTTTMTLGTGHNIIAYTNADDVIDGGEYAEIKMCRRSNGDVNTIVTELLNAD